MEYSITIKELLKRTEIINPEQPFEYLQKMTDAEIEQWEDEVEMKLDMEGPAYEGEDLDSKRIDRHVLYETFKLGTETNGSVNFYHNKEENRFYLDFNKYQYVFDEVGCLIGLKGK